MKKFLSMLLIFGLFIGLSGCGSKDEPKEESTGGSKQEEKEDKTQNGLTFEDVPEIKEKSDEILKVMNDAFKKEELVFDSIEKDKEGRYTVFYKTSLDATFRINFDQKFKFTGVNSVENGDSEENHNIFSNLCLLSTYIPDFGITEITEDLSMSLAGLSDDIVSLDKCEVMYVDSLKMFIISMK